MPPAFLLTLALAATPAGPDLEAMQAAYTAAPSVASAQRLLEDAGRAAEPFFAQLPIPPDDPGRCALARLLVRQARTLSGQLLQEGRTAPVGAPTPLLSAFDFAFGQAGWCRAQRAALKGGYAKAMAALAVQRLGPEKVALEQSDGLLGLLATIEHGPAGQAALKASNALHLLAEAPAIKAALAEYVEALQGRLDSMRTERAGLRCVAGTAIVKLTDRPVSTRTETVADPDFAQELSLAQLGARTRQAPLPAATPVAGALYQVKLVPCRAKKLPAVEAAGPWVVLHAAGTLAYKQTFEVAASPGAPQTLPDADRQPQTWTVFTEKDLPQIDQDLAVTQTALAGVQAQLKRLAEGGQYAAARAQVVSACRGW